MAQKKMVGKGHILRQTIGGTLTAVAQVISIDHSGAEVQTFDSTTLDSGVGREYDTTGYSEGGSVSCEIFYDAELGGHQSITDELTTPPTTQTVWDITFTDDSAKVAAFTSAGVGFDFSITQEDGVKATVTHKINGLLAYPT